jgi:nucleoside phosphorylase
MTDIPSDSDRSAEPEEQQPEHPPDRSTADIAIICSHTAEIRPFLKRLDRIRKYSDRGCTFRGGFLHEVVRVAIVTAPRGFVGHRVATEILQREHHPRWIFSAGFSSAIAPELKSGDLCVSTEICDTHGNSQPVKCSIPASKRIHVGRLVTADGQPTTAEAKQLLFETSGALAVDTTSLAVAQICANTETRFLAIRAVCDEQQETIPEQAAALIFDSGSRAIGKAAGTLFQGFSRLKELHSWRQRSITAAQNMDRFLAGIVEQLAERIVQQRS